MLNLIAWVILGLLAGAIAKMIYPSTQGGGFIATMFLGIIGAFVGGSLLSFIQTGSLQLIGASLSIPGVAVAVLGAIIAIAIWNFFNRG